MAYYEKKCGNCGATVIKGDVMCRTCGKLIQNDCRYIEKEEDTIEGVPVSDISLFIDKNSSRYVDIFSRNKGKKIFFNMNWSAFFRWESRKAILSPRRKNRLRNGPGSTGSEPDRKPLGSDPFH